MPPPQYIGPSRGGISRHEHTTDILSSCLQKNIRRGEYEKALYSALQLMEFADIVKAKALVTRTLNRLRVIVLEDIGIANPSLLARFNTLYESLEEKRTNKILLARIIQLLAKSPKSRICSDIKAVYFTDPAKTQRLFPGLYINVTAISALDYRYKFESGDGEEVRRWGRGIITGLMRKWNHIFYWTNQFRLAFENRKTRKIQVAARWRSDNPANLLFDILFEYARKGSALWGMKAVARPKAGDPKIFNPRLLQALQICFDYYKHFKDHRDNAIFYIYPVLLCIRYADIDWAVDNTVADNATLLADCKHELAKPRPIDDYCIDVHTREGKHAGADAIQFALEGSIVENEDMSVFMAPYRYVYLFLKDVPAADIKAYFTEHYPQIPYNAILTSLKLPTVPTKSVKKSVTTKTVTKTVVKKPSITKTVVKKPSITKTVAKKPSTTTTKTVVKKPSITKTVAKKPSITKTVAKKFPFDGTCIPTLKRGTCPPTGKSETDIFSPILFANVSMKMNTYFSVMRYPGFSPANVLVKGPFINDIWKYSVCVDELKPLLGLHKIGFHYMRLNHDVYVKGKRTEGTEYLFLISRDFGKGVATYPSITHTGKAMHGVQRMDKDKIQIPQMGVWLKTHDLAKNPTILAEYCRILLFRQIIQTTDTNNTNIIIDQSKGTLLSLDENLRTEGFMNGQLFSGNQNTTKLAPILRTELKKPIYLTLLKEWLTILNSPPVKQLCKEIYTAEFANTLINNTKRCIVIASKNAWKL